LALTFTYKDGALFIKTELYPIRHILYPIRYSVFALTELNYNTKTVKIMDKRKQFKELLKNSKPLTEEEVQAQTKPELYTVLPVVFSFNERVIWHSHFGYELGYFLGEGNQYNTYLIDKITGLIHEPCSHSKSEIHKYSEKLIAEFKNKYGYEKKFIDDF
jgi:hypothetical protein